MGATFSVKTQSNATRGTPVMPLWMFRFNWFYSYVLGYEVIDFRHLCFAFGWNGLLQAMLWGEIVTGMVVTGARYRYGWYLIIAEQWEGWGAASTHSAFGFWNEVLTFSLFPRIVPYFIRPGVVPDHMTWAGYMLRRESLTSAQNISWSSHTIREKKRVWFHFWHVALLRYSTCIRQRDTRQVNIYWVELEHD